MSRVLLGIAMLVSLAVPGGLITSWVASSASNASQPSAPPASSAESSNGSATSSGTGASPFPAAGLTAAQHNQLIDEINALLQLHERLIKSFNASGPPDLSDASRATDLSVRISSWEATYGGINRKLDRVANAGSRFASVLASLLRTPQSDAAFNRYKASVASMRAAIAAAK